MKKFIMVITIFSMFIIAPNSFAYLNSIANSNQSQGQEQSQTQNSTNSSLATQGQTTVVGVGELIKNSFNAGSSKRGFAIPNDIHYPGMPSYFGKAIPSFQFQSATKMLMYKSVFSVAELRRMAEGEGSSARIITTLVTDEYKIANDEKEEQIIENLDGSVSKSKIKKDIEKRTHMVIYLTKPKINVDLVGYITVASKSKVGLSVKTMAQAALAAYEMGANIVHITAEGAERKLTTSGWGIGFNQTHATMYGGGEGSSGVSSGGTGYSTGTAGYRDLPWIQVFALKTISNK
jgi:hypothetical protein